MCFTGFTICSKQIWLHLQEIGQIQRFCQSFNLSSTVNKLFPQVYLQATCDTSVFYRRSYQVGLRESHIFPEFQCSLPSKQTIDSLC